MWLLDVNVPVQILKIIEQHGIKAQRTDKLGWAHLQNGDLVKEAAKNGYTCLLTRDKLFGESAAKSLTSNSNFAVILLIIPQTSGARYAEIFSKHWNKNPIKPLPGKVVSWPKE